MMMMMMEEGNGKGNVLCIWPENTAWEEDLVVQLLWGAPFDDHALLVVHFNMLPHIVGGRNWTHVVDLQPETKWACCFRKWQLSRNSSNVMRDFFQGKVMKQKLPFTGAFCSESLSTSSTSTVSRKGLNLALCLLPPAGLQLPAKTVALFDLCSTCLEVDKSKALSVGAVNTWLRVSSLNSDSYTSPLWRHKRLIFTIVLYYNLISGDFPAGDKYFWEKTIGYMNEEERFKQKSPVATF